MVIYPSVRIIIHYSCYPRFLQMIYIYPLRYIFYLGKKSRDIISNYNDTFIHIFMHLYDPNFKIYILNRFFLGQFCRFICQCIFFLANITYKTLSFFTSCIFSSVDIIKVSVMSSTIIQYS